VTKAERDAQFEHYYKTYSTRELAEMMVNADEALERRRRPLPKPHAAKLLARASNALAKGGGKHASLAKEIRDYLDACGVPMPPIETETGP